MTDADIIREQLRHLAPLRGGAAEAALERLVAERDMAVLDAALNRDLYEQARDRDIRTLAALREAEAR